MRVIDLIEHSSQTAFSFELLPPLKGTGIEKVYADIETLMPFNPQYINITTHRSEYVYNDLGNGLYERNKLKRRPGTVAVAAAIRNKYDINVVPHVLCSGFTPQDTEYMLFDLQFLDITDLLVLRGDKARHMRQFVPEKGGHEHTLELQKQINAFNKGIMVDGQKMHPVPQAPFSYGVACYPEKHEEAPNLDTDIYYLKQKIDNGAQYAVTQLFYDNKKYFDFVERVRQAGICVPIIPGIKPIYKSSQLSLLPQTFKVDLPQDLVKEVQKCGDNEQYVKQVGIEWCINQCKELMAHNVPSLHFYAAGAVQCIKEVAQHIY